MTDGFEVDMVPELFRLLEELLDTDPRVTRLVETETPHSLAKSVIYERARAEAWRRAAERAREET